MNKNIRNTCQKAQVLIFAVLALTSCGKKETTVAAPSAIEIQALRIAKSDVPISMEFVGQTKGAVDAEIRARVEGVVLSLHFEEGKEVKEGQLLYKIDPAPYVAKVAEAQGKVAEASAMLVKAKSDLERIRPLAKMKAMSEKDLDRAVAMEGSARASLDAANANLDSAKIQLSYCEVSAPVSGTIGMTKARVGEFVGRAPNPIVLNTVSQLDPIHVKFSISEKDYLYFARLKQKQIDSGETAEKRQLRLILADGSVFPVSGEVISLERAIDSTTGTFPVEAAFANKNQLLRPGQFAKIQTVAETVKGAILIPKKAVRELQGQYQVVVIKSDNTAEPRSVTLSTAVGEKQVVDSGLSDGEIIALDGLQLLKSGTLVSPKF